MNLESAIRDRWATYEPLTMLVPLSRFWTGPVPADVELPYVALDKPRVETRLRTSSKWAIEHASLRMTIVAAELDEAAAIERQIERRFAGATFALDGGTVDEGTVLDMLRERVEARRTDAGDWQVVAEYLAITEHLPQGD